MHELAEHAAVLAQVVLIDLVLAGDNAIIVGLAAAGLPTDLRRRAIMLGIVAALACRIAFSLVAIQLLAIIGLTLAGGILLLWVAWKMAREIRSQGKPFALQANRFAPWRFAPKPPKPNDLLPDRKASRLPPKSFRSAVAQIVVADVTMSLDNVLAVAGAASQHVWIMAFGLVLSVALMGAAAEFVARLLLRWHWLSYIGLAVVLYVALSMIWRGWDAVAMAFAL
jgi:YjbE family integral membrane protein